MKDKMEELKKEEKEILSKTKELESKIEMLERENEEIRLEVIKAKEQALKDYQAALEQAQAKETLTKEDMHDLISKRTKLVDLKPETIDPDNSLSDDILKTKINEVLKEAMADPDIIELFDKARKYISNDKLTYELETLDSKIPEQNYFINNRLMQKLVSGEVKEGKTELVVSGSKNKEVITLIDINYDDDNIQIQDKDSRFTNDHRQVYNALATFWEAGNEFFTPSQVYRCMNGYSNTEKVSSKQIERVTDLIDENRVTNARIDFTEEARARNKDVEKYVVEDSIISAKKVTLSVGGTTVEGYKFNSKPILYEYAQISQQIYTVPSHILNTKEYIRSTPEVMTMKDYFITSIEWMKSKNNPRSRNLTLKSIYKEIEVVDPSADKTRKVRNNAARILDSFVDKEYIKDYKFYKEGRSFKGIEIIL